MVLFEIGLLQLKPINLPDNVYNTFFYLNQLDLPSKASMSCEAMQVRYGNNLQNVYYSSLGPFLSQIPRGSAGVSGVLAKRLGLSDGENVFISLCNAGSLSMVFVRPQTNDDYNILTNMANIMENIMLYQVRVLAPGQLLPAKVGNIVVDLYIEAVKPTVELGRLEQYTEMIIIDPGSPKQFSSSSDSTVQLNSLPTYFWSLYRWASSLLGAAPPPAKKLTDKEILNIAFKRRQKKIEYRVVQSQRGCHSFLAYANVSQENNGRVCCKITKVPEKTSLVRNKDGTKDEKQVYFCEVLPLPFKSDNENEVQVCANVMKKLGWTMGTKVHIEIIDKIPDTVNRNEQFITTEREINEDSSFIYPSLKEIIDKLELSLKHCMERKMTANALITGPIGSGKTFLLKNLSRICGEKNIYCCVVNCKSLRGKQIESLLKILSAKWSECAYREPSVLIFDDMDAFMYQMEDDKSESALKTSAYCKRLSTMISELSNSFSKVARICVVASAISTSSLGPTLSTVRGPRLFSLVLNIPEMASTDRLSYLSQFGIEGNKELGEKLNGYRIQDLTDLVSRSKLKSLLAKRRELTLDDVESALEEMTPLALQGVQVKAEVPYTYDDVGGMEEVKRCLDEIFRWPSQFPEIFASCPLRSQRGALLYGPPGCGKTFIAGALANECGMNFKNVKGPELLSKFVGASEAAVRDIFRKAQEAKPCLLFFDELDSLAPRRGADSTGVTDRVVNQLLTELDGVESRTGVWVLGASSRPDLIDPALLRPGRLDRTVYCPVPSLEDREKILIALVKNLELDDDLSLSAIAKQTDGFTGADLQALLYNAQMKVFQGDENSEEMSEKVSSFHISAAILETKPSLTLKDKLMHEKIAERFQAAKKEKKTPMIMSQSQKVTFA